MSSVGLFDRGARVMVWLAVLLSGFQWWLCVQHLDDLCAVGPAFDNSLDVFYEKYFSFIFY